MQSMPPNFGHDRPTLATCATLAPTPTLAGKANLGHMQASLQSWEAGQQPWRGQPTFTRNFALARRANFGHRCPPNHLGWVNFGHHRCPPTLAAGQLCHRSMRRPTLPVRSMPANLGRPTLAKETGCSSQYEDPAHWMSQLQGTGRVRRASSTKLRAGLVAT